MQKLYSAPIQKLQFKFMWYHKIHIMSHLFASCVESLKSVRTAWPHNMDWTGRGKKCKKYVHILKLACPLDIACGYNQGGHICSTSTNHCKCTGSLNLIRGLCTFYLVFSFICRIHERKASLCSRRWDEVGHILNQLCMITKLATEKFT